MPTIILVISSIPILILIDYTLWTANMMCLYKQFRLLNDFFCLSIECIQFESASHKSGEDSISKYLKNLLNNILLYFVKIPYFYIP